MKGINEATYYYPYNLFRKKVNQFIIQQVFVLKRYQFISIRFLYSSISIQRKTNFSRSSKRFDCPISIVRNTALAVSYGIKTLNDGTVEC